MEKYKNKYRIASAPLHSWDYGSPGLYFITANTKNREHYFGEIINNKMVLNELGMMVNTQWELTPEIRPYMNLGLGEYIVMPNHFHGIFIEMPCMASLPCALPPACYPPVPHQPKNHPYPLHS